MSFRFSHYFVSFLSEGTSILCGIGTEVSQEGQQITVWYVKHKFVCWFHKHLFNFRPNYASIVNYQVQGRLGKLAIVKDSKIDGSSVSLSSE